MTEKEQRLEKLEIRRLSRSFYEDNEHLVEALDKDRHTGKFSEKALRRGYGVLLLQVNGLDFAIPFRTNLTHKHGFASLLTHKPKGKVERSGLDYSKAVLITDPNYIDGREFKLRTDKEFFKVANNEDRIISEFESFVQKYVDAVKTNDQNILNEYQWSTLQNYHQELGL